MPIPKFDADARALGYWQADEVMQTDVFTQGRGASVDGEELAPTDTVAPPAGWPAKGNEHLTMLRESYLQLLASEQRFQYLRLEAGAAGYLLKDAEADELAAAIRAAYRGEVHLDPAVARKLTQSLVAPRNAVSALTARECEVLALVAQGQSNNEIADALVISERTARTHVSNILGKLGLPSRTQAALWAVREGLAIGP